MKTSKRLMLGTFAVLLAAPVVLAAYGRISGAGLLYELPAPDRPTPADLAALRDFDTIVVRGDFALEVVNAPEYSVTYTPLTANLGSLRASVDDGTLRIEGYFNRTAGTAGTVRVTLPGLSRIDAQSLFSLTVRDFDSDTLALGSTGVQRLILENNRIDTLDMTLEATFNVDLRDNQIGSSRMTQFGTTITTE